MEQLISFVIDAVSELPSSTVVMVVSALGVLGVWLAARYIDKHAGGF